MSGLPGGDRATSVGVEEVDVSIRIEDGKLTTESKSGPKSGSVALDTDGDAAELVLSGAGRDRASATLSKPELSSFRAAIDGALSDVTTDRTDPGANDAVYSGEATIQRLDDGLGIAIDGAALEGSDGALEPGAASGERRQAPCTILDSGVAIVDLAGDGED